MWNRGDVVAWRGIFRGRIWHVQPTIVVNDSPSEIVVTLLPGTECMADENYPSAKKTGKRRWDFKEQDWKLRKYIWRANRLLLLFEPEKFYSTILFWNHTSHEFLYYYINFQQPFKRGHNSIDTLDLDLDLIINPDFSTEWKDEDDYQMAIKHEIISSEWVQAIEDAKPEIFERIEKRLYPYDGSWLDWRPDPQWEPPKLPENWDKV